MMNTIWLTVALMLGANLWLVAGSICLWQAIRRRAVQQPRQLLQALLWMTLWPWLVWKSMRFHFVKSLAS